MTNNDSLQFGDYVTNKHGFTRRVVGFTGTFADPAVILLALNGRVDSADRAMWADSEYRPAAKIERTQFEILCSPRSEMGLRKGDPVSATDDTASWADETVSTDTQLTIDDGERLAQAVRTSDRVAERGIKPVLEVLSDLAALDMPAHAKAGVELAECLLLALAGNVAAGEVVDALIALSADTKRRPTWAEIGDALWRGATDEPTSQLTDDTETQ